MKKKIHINQHVIRSNKKNGTNDPVITVKTSKSNTYANEVEIFGKSKLVYSPIKPLPKKPPGPCSVKLYPGSMVLELADRKPCSPIAESWPEVQKIFDSLSM
jgi:hypothetical protein